MQRPLTKEALIYLSKNTAIQEFCTRIDQELAFSCHLSRFPCHFSENSADITSKLHFIPENRIYGEITFCKSPPRGPTPRGDPQAPPAGGHHLARRRNRGAGGGRVGDRRRA